MILDNELRVLPSAPISRRVGAFLLDRLLLVLIPALSLVVIFPIVLVLNIVFSDFVSRVALIALLAIVYIFTLIQANLLRVGETAQTLGMSLMDISIASADNDFKSNFMNKWFFWVRIESNKTQKAWANNEVEERTYAQLWRGIVPVVFYPLLALLTLVVFQAVGRLPFVIWSLIHSITSNSEFQLSSSNNFVNILLGIPVLLTFLVAELGFLFALGQEKRTLVDHFLGIKVVDVKSTQHSFKPKNASNILQWFLGNKINKIVMN